MQATRVGREARLRGVLEGGDAVLTVLRYIEPNPLRAALVASCQRWRWSSPAWWAEPASAPDFWRRQGYPRPDDWLDYVKRRQTDKELEALRRCLRRGAPFGRQEQGKRMAGEWGLQSTLRSAAGPGSDKTGPDP